MGESLLTPEIVAIIEGFAGDIVPTVLGLIGIVVPVGLTLWGVGFGVRKGLSFLQKNGERNMG